MVKEILASNSTLREKLKQLLLYLSRRRGAKIVWTKRHEVTFNKHPGFREPLDEEILQRHRHLWEPFNKKFSNATLKICRSISGIADPLIIPEEIFQTDIEPTLNHHSEAHYLAHKSFYNRWFEKGVFPDDLLHVVNGELLDSDYNTISENQATELCKTFSYPVVLKPNQETWGGNNIRFVNNSKNLMELVRRKQNAVIQKKILQHPELSKYHPPSLNTVRIYLYRSVTDNKIYILNTVLRMGNGGAVDNVTSGGLVSRIKKDGYLHGYALDLYGGTYTQHPVSGLPFTGAIPDFKELKELAKEIAQKLFLLRIVGLDLCYDYSGRWRAIEINTRGHSIRFSQYAGEPFFGEHMEEVIEYCKSNHWAISSGS